VLTRDHTVLPATHTFIHIRKEAFTSQPQRIAALWPVFISRPAEISVVVIAAAAQLYIHICSSKGDTLIDS